MSNANVQSTSRICWHHQGQFSSASTTYPTGTPSESGGSPTDDSAPSNTVGVHIPKRNVGEKLLVKLVAKRAAGAANCYVNGWGYTANYQSAANPTVTTTFASGTINGWDSIGALNAAQNITVATGAVNSVNVVNVTGNTFNYVEVVNIGGLYDYVLFKPVSGTFDTVDVFVGYQAGG